MSCIIEWNVLNLEEWKSRFSCVRRANLLQSYNYALAACAVNRQSARWGLIKIKGVDAGLVQILEAKLFGQVFHALIIDRGPLWFEGFGDEAHILSFTKAINKHFPHRIGRRRRFIPEASGLTSLPGFNKMQAQSYQTLWLDLTEDEGALRAGLKKKWRNVLSRAEKSALNIEWDDTGAHFKELLKGYVVDKAAKGYDGPSVQLLQALAKTFRPGGHMLIGRALAGDKLCASVLILCHGKSATYQISWSDDIGRKEGAHHILLWQALLQLKGKSIKDFDLGGINEQSAKGVKLFKEGLGAQPITLSGLYT